MYVQSSSIAHMPAGWPGRPGGGVPGQFPPLMRWMMMHLPSSGTQKARARAEAVSDWNSSCWALSVRG